MLSLSGAFAWAQGSLRGCRDPKGAASSSATRYGEGLGAGVPKTTLTGGPGRPCRPVKPRWPFSPLSPASPVSPLSPRGPWGPWKGRRGHVRLRVADPHPVCPRTPCLPHGMLRRAQHHSPACLERQQDRRDPWDLVHPRETKEASRKGPGARDAEGCPVPLGVSELTPLPPSCPARSTSNRQLPVPNGVFKYPQPEHPRRVTILANK